MKTNVNTNVNSKTTNVSGWWGEWDKKFCFDDSFEGGKLYKSKDKAKDAKQFIESLLSKQRAELVEKVEIKIRTMIAWNQQSRAYSKDEAIKKVYSNNIDQLDQVLLLLKGKL